MVRNRGRPIRGRQRSVCRAIDRAMRRSTQAVDASNRLIGDPFSGLMRHLCGVIDFVCRTTNVEPIAARWRGGINLGPSDMQWQALTPRVDKTLFF